MSLESSFGSEIPTDDLFLFALEELQLQVENDGLDPGEVADILSTTANNIADYVTNVANSIDDQYSSSGLFEGLVLSPQLPSSILTIANNLFSQIIDVLGDGLQDIGQSLEDTTLGF